MYKRHTRADVCGQVVTSGVTRSVRVYAVIRNERVGAVIRGVRARHVREHTRRSACGVCVRVHVGTYTMRTRVCTKEFFFVPSVHSSSVKNFRKF